MRSKVRGFHGTFWVQSCLTVTVLPTQEKKSMPTNVPPRGPHHIKIKTCPITVRGVGTKELGGGSTKGGLGEQN